jgi:hypothetical protein
MLMRTSRHQLAHMSKYLPPGHHPFFIATFPEFGAPEHGHLDRIVPVSQIQYTRRLLSNFDRVRICAFAHLSPSFTLRAGGRDAVPVNSLAVSYQDVPICSIPAF